MGYKSLARNLLKYYFGCYRWKPDRRYDFVSLGSLPGLSRAVILVFFHAWAHANCSCRQALMTLVRKTIAFFDSSRNIIGVSLSYSQELSSFSFCRLSWQPLTMKLVVFFHCYSVVELGRCLDESRFRKIPTLSKCSANSSAFPSSLRAHWLSPVRNGGLVGGACCAK